MNKLMAAFLSTMWYGGHYTLHNLKQMGYIYVCYYYAMFSSFLSLLNFVTMFIVYATFCSVNVLIFIGSTAGPLSYLVKRLGSKGKENEKRLLQLLFFSVSSASTSTIPAIKEYRSFHGQFVFFFLP